MHFQHSTDCRATHPLAIEEDDLIQKSSRVRVSDSRTYPFGSSTRPRRTHPSVGTTSEKIRTGAIHAQKGIAQSAIPGLTLDRNINAISLAKQSIDPPACDVEIHRKPSCCINSSRCAASSHA